MFFKGDFKGHHGNAVSATTLNPPQTKEMRETGEAKL